MSKSIGTVVLSAFVGAIAGAVTITMLGADLEEAHYWYAALRGLSGDQGAPGLFARKAARVSEGHRGEPPAAGV